VRFHGAARIVLGAEPGCDTGPDAEALARGLAEAGLDAACSARIRDDQWLKLCVNLMSAPNALVRRGDHESAAFVELKARLLEEARAALAAAGIRAASCDGRDRDLDAEIRFQRASLARGTSARPAPLYNHVWTGLREGRPLGAEDYHRLILGLASRHGLPAPRNLRVLAALERAVQEGLGPECVSAAELLEDGTRLAGTPAAG
jgi:2-dehydropantoate 2-reductase